MIALVNAVERRVVAALNAEGDFFHAQLAHFLQFLDGLVADIGDAGAGLDVLHLRQIVIDHHEDRL